VAVNDHRPEAAVSVDAKTQHASCCPETVNTAQNFLRGRYRAGTVTALGVAGVVIAVFIQRSSSLQNNFSLVANICAVFSPCATLVTGVKASAGNVLLALRGA
jgi:hypothetical protein